MNQARATFLSRMPARRSADCGQRPAREIEADPATTPEILSAAPPMRTRPLRRWSVAELIARAAVAPPGDGVARRYSE